MQRSRAEDPWLRPQHEKIQYNSEDERCHTFWHPDVQRGRPANENQEESGASPENTEEEEKEER